MNYVRDLEYFASAIFPYPLLKIPRQSRWGWLVLWVHLAVGHQPHIPVPGKAVGLGGCIGLGPFAGGASG
jgi:hypothetical protein